MGRRMRHLFCALAIFAFGVALRRRFFCGFVLGDDGQEYAVIGQILRYGPLWSDQLHLRFGGWVPNYVALKLFGISEPAFFLPTWILSAGLGVLAYAILVVSGYGIGVSLLQGLVVVSAPFEVVMGAVRSNDLYLEFTLAVGLLILVRLRTWPVVQGCLLAVCLWYGFYVKLWVVYVLPALGFHYLGQLRRRVWRGAVTFTVASLVLHGATCLFWQSRLGTLVPFINIHAANYRVPRSDLGDLFLKYPRLVFSGSEFGTTLFGAVPYILVVLLAVKLVARWLPGARAFGRWDRLDGALLVLYGSFFLLLNFFPNGFGLDGYYSVPRIFRYLAPLSFPLTLHAAKLVADLSAALAQSWEVAPMRMAAAMLAPVIALGVVQAGQATAPARNFRRVFLAVLEDVKQAKPPVLLAEQLTVHWFKDLYFTDVERGATRVPIAGRTYAARDYERWLETTQPTLPVGTMLVTGLGGYVFYGAHWDGFRLPLFARPLDPAWELVKEYEMLSYLPSPEPGRLWRLTRALAPPAPPPVPADAFPDEDAETLMRLGMADFDKGSHPAARARFKALVDRFPAAPDDARFFYAASYYREQNWPEALAAFEALVKASPNSRWVSGAQFHIGRCYQELGNSAEARKRFEDVLENYPEDTSTGRLAREALGSLPDAQRGFFFDLMERVRRLFGG